MKDVLISTTNTIENADIERYIELLSANVVVGTNLFSDFAASFTDLFGGYSTTYQRKIDKIYDAALDLLKDKAKRKGANAVIGVKLDIGEISGKGKSMFMISAAGTAVKLSYRGNIPESKKLEVPNELLVQEILRHGIIMKVQAGELPSERDWSFLLNSPIDEIFEPLLTKYIEYCHKDLDALYPTLRFLVENFPNYVGLIDRDLAIKTLYGNLQRPCVIDLLQQNQLFDPNLILSMLKLGAIHEAILCLSVSKSSYTVADLHVMQEIVDLFCNLPNKGNLGMVKGMFKTSEKFICPNGHKNELSADFCVECGVNIKGLTKREVSEISQFETRVKILKEILQN